MPVKFKLLKTEDKSQLSTGSHVELIVRPDGCRVDNDTYYMTPICMTFDEFSCRIDRYVSNLNKLRDEAKKFFK